MSKCSIFYKFWKMRQVSFLCVLCCCYCEIASVLSDSVQPHSRQPTRLPRPWDSPGKNTGVGCHFLLQCMKMKSESEVTQSCPTLRDPMDCSLPGSSVHGIFQARVLEWVAIAFSVLLCTLGHHNLSLGTLHKAEQARDAFKLHGSVQFSRSGVSDSATPRIAARQASLSITNSRSSLKLTSIESVMPSSHLILCCPLLLLPPIPRSIRVFSNESTLHMR